jgi:ABC-type lipoprotein release transport system permease subunit
VQLEKEIVRLRCQGLNEEQIKDILVLFFTSLGTLDEVCSRYLAARQERGA